MSMALVILLLVVLWLTWGHIKPSVEQLGIAAQNSTEALAKASIKINVEAGKDLSEDVFAQLAKQRELLKKM